MNSTPATISTAPTTTCHVSFSLRKMAASVTENTSATFVSGDTREASPSDSARKDSREEAVVSTPAVMRNSQLLRSILPSSGSSPSYTTAPHDTTMMSTA